MVSAEIGLGRVERWLLSLGLIETGLVLLERHLLFDLLWLLLHVGHHLLHLVEVRHHLLHHRVLLHHVLLSLKLLLLHLLLLVLLHQLVVVVVNLNSFSLRNSDVWILDKDLSKFFNFQAFIEERLLLLKLLGHLLGLELLLPWLPLDGNAAWLLHLSEILLLHLAVVRLYLHWLRLRVLLWDCLHLRLHIRDVYLLHLLLRHVDGLLDLNRLLHLSGNSLLPSRLVLLGHCLHIWLCLHSLNQSLFLRFTHGSASNYFIGL